MHAKLHINISQGVVDVEGDLELVREVYTDFKDNLLNVMNSSTRLAAEDMTSTEPETEKKTKRSRVARKKVIIKERGSNINADSPKMDKAIDTSGLATFYGQFEPKNHPERILIFLKFLTDELGVEAPNTDQVYTCYMVKHERVPKAFAQAFRDASGRNFGYIDYKSPTELLITTRGNNHFMFDLKKKGAE